MYIMAVGIMATSDLFQYESHKSDCAQPFIYATDNNIDVDIFIIFTDNETYAGDIHADKALITYRKKMRAQRLEVQSSQRSQMESIKEAKLIVCSMNTSACTITNIEDPRVLDIPGLSPHLPELIAQFDALEFDSY